VVTVGCKKDDDQKRSSLFDVKKGDTISYRMHRVSLTFVTPMRNFNKFGIF